MYLAKKLITACLLFTVAMLCNLPPAVAQNAPQLDANSTFFKAGENYNAGKYQEAAKLYESALNEKQNGYLYYNLGNAYFKMNKLGLALLNYRRAQRLIPRFEDLISNLQYAREEAKDKIESKGYTQAKKRIFFWYYLFNKKELITAFLIINFIFFFLAGIYIYAKTDVLKWLMVVLAIVYFSLGASVLTRIYQESKITEGVVTAQEIAVRSGYGTNNVVLFKLHEGAEFMVKGIKADWFKIELADGKKGWIQNSGAEII